MSFGVRVVQGQQKDTKYRHHQSAHSDQASRVVTRALILPTLCSTALVPTVTTPLYRVSVSRALRQPLRVSFSEHRSAEPSKAHPR